MDPGSLVAVWMFIGASISDLSTRRVPNRFWLPFLAAAVFLALPDPDWPGIAGALVVAALFYLFWRFGLFGGGDAKGLMVVAFLTPSMPDLLDARTFLALDALVNGTLFMVFLPLVFVVWNGLRGDLRFPAALLGVRADLAWARNRHLWPMQEVEASALRWRYMHRPGSDVDAVFMALRNRGLERVWVTPKIPFMVPLTIGLALAAAGGNLVLRAMAAVLG